MKKISIFLAEGFEEVEALTQVDLLRRAGAQVTMVSIGDRLCGKKKGEFEMKAGDIITDGSAKFRLRHVGGG